MFRYLYVLCLFVSLPLYSQVQVLTISTTSKLAEWSPQRVVKSGGDLVWKAKAAGMADQIQITNTTNPVPVFDLSVPRTASEVKITVTSADGSAGFKELTVNSLNLTAIDLRKAHELTKLSCIDNQLKNLDVSGNPNLTNLFCHSNPLKNLDVTRNVKLSKLACYSTQISSLNVSQNVDLTQLSCSDNQIVHLDLSNNLLLVSLECNNNQLNYLDLKNGSNTILSKFNSKNNPELFCIQVDDAQYSTVNWTDRDTWSEFSEDCTFSPVAKDDTYSTLENTVLSVAKTEGVLVNDTDPKNKPLTAKLETNVSNGILILKEDGSFTYTPFSGFSGTDLFTYKANNGENDSKIATVTIEVIYVNKPPVARDISYKMQEDGVLTISKSNGVLSNDTDPEDDELTAILIDNTQHGTLNLNSDGSFVYTPDQGFYGQESFTYKASDGALESNIAKVTISVAKVNKPPEANDIGYETDENILLEVNADKGVLSNDIDPDKDQLTAILTEDVKNGDLVLNSDGSFNYLPDDGFYGEDMFTYKANDGKADSNTAEVKIKVNAVSKIIIPSAFTPNNDGYNDFFKPEFKGMENVKLDIFDTWGNLIYQEEGKEINGWDGMIKGKYAENGNYLYAVSVITLEQKYKVYKGLFSLIR